jgi:hypothetical protein
VSDTVRQAAPPLVEFGVSHKLVTWRQGVVVAAGVAPGYLAASLFAAPPLVVFGLFAVGIPAACVLAFTRVSGRLLVDQVGTLARHWLWRRWRRPARARTLGFGVTGENIDDATQSPPGELAHLRILAHRPPGGEVGVLWDWQEQTATVVVPLRATVNAVLDGDQLAVLHEGWRRALDSLGEQGGCRAVRWLCVVTPGGDPELEVAARSNGQGGGGWGEAYADLTAEVAPHATTTDVYLAVAAAPGDAGRDAAVMRDPAHPASLATLAATRAAVRLGGVLRSPALRCGSPLDVAQLSRLVRHLTTPDQHADRALQGAGWPAAAAWPSATATNLIDRYVTDGTSHRLFEVVGWPSRPVWAGFLSAVTGAPLGTPHTVAVEFRPRDRSREIVKHERNRASGDAKADTFARLGFRRTRAADQSAEKGDTLIDHLLAGAYPVTVAAWVCLSAGPSPADVDDEANHPGYVAEWAVLRRLEDAADRLLAAAAPFGLRLARRDGAHPDTFRKVLP